MLQRVVRATAARRRTYWGTQSWQDQALTKAKAMQAEALAKPKAPVSLETLRSLPSFRPGIAYVLDALYFRGENIP